MRKLLTLVFSGVVLACGTPQVKPVEQGAASEAVVIDNKNSNYSNANAGSVADRGTVSAADVKRHLEYLASDKLKGRNTGSPEIDLAAQYIEEQFQKSGVTPYFDSYRDAFMAKDIEAFNVVGVLEGTDPDLKDEYIVIGAHYDHIGSGKAVNGDEIANGANDNASGTSAVIELANYFAKAKTNKRSLIFALFSAEEKGLLGSKHLAEKLKSANLNLYTMFNIEMIGVPMTGKDYMVYLTGYENSNMAQRFNVYAGQKVIGFLPQAKQYNLFKRSDNYPFYESFKVPSQTVSTFDFTNYDYYHHVDDEVQELNPTHMAQVINALIPGVEEMSSTATQEIKLNE